MTMFRMRISTISSGQFTQRLRLKCQSWIFFMPQLDTSVRSKHTYCHHQQQNNGQRDKYFMHRASVVLCGAAVACGIIYYKKGDHILVAKSPDVQNTERDQTLPTYSLEEVAKHSTNETGIWVTYGTGVYDVTDFVPQHPGGPEKILMAAGGSVEPFWLLYGVHKTPSVLHILEKRRIGNLTLEDAAEAIANMEDPYAKDPRRHVSLKPSSLKPFNAEPPPSLLTSSFITPVELFYVRNHLPVPVVMAEEYTLEIAGLNPGEEYSLTLNDLKNKFPKVTVTAAIMCAGNRRGEMTKIKPVKGLNWGHAAIGNATWSGAKLVDVLKYFGIKDDDPRIQHVQFEGLDTDVSNVPYGASIPVEKALDARGDVILAYEMNGQPLSRDHGYPVRAVVPGTVGARNVKWLSRIILSEQESDSHWQQNDYKGFNPSVDWDTVDFTKSPAIQELPVISAICSPEDGSTVNSNADGSVNVKGYAWSGGGRRIVRIDVSADEGKTWFSADFEQENKKEPRHYGWTLWSVDVPVPKGVGEAELWAKAVDSSYNTQPESFANIWNLRGVLGNAYHRVHVKLNSSLNK